MFSTRPTDDAGLNYYTLVTLIDITKTDAVHLYSPGMTETEADYNVKRNQQRNYQSLLQVIGLRCQPMIISEPVMYPDEKMEDFEKDFEQKFGTNFTTGNVWSFMFAVEQEDVFLSPTGPCGLLFEDAHNVPIVTGLLENVTIKVPIIDTFNAATRNTIISK